MNEQLGRWAARLRLVQFKDQIRHAHEVADEMMEHARKPAQWAVCRTYMPEGEAELKFVRASTEAEALWVFPELVGHTEEELNKRGIAYCVRRVLP